MATTKRRFEVLKILRDAGIPTVVWLCPILPFINDTKENIEGILNYCIEAKVYGIICFDMGLTLREGNREFFYAKLDELFPGMKERYIKNYGNSYELSSPDGHELMKLFKQKCEENNIVCDIEKVFEYLNTFETDSDFEQLSLF